MNPNRKQPAAPRLDKEIAKMPTRLVTMLAVAFTFLAVLPVAGASATSPWWQVLDGSRPTHLWEPSDSVQEIKTERVDTGEGLEGYIGLLAVKGETMGCLAAGGAAFFCEALLGMPAIESAAQLEAALQTTLGSTGVTVTGGPVGGDPLVVTVEDRLLPIELSPLLGTSAVKVIASGGSGRLALTILNLGNAPVDGGANPTTIVDKLPEGVVATGVEAIAGVSNEFGPVACTVENPSRVSCSYTGNLRPFEAIEVDVLVNLTGTPPAAGDPGEIIVSGGGAPLAREEQTIEVSPEPVPYGIEHFSVEAEEEGGQPATQAGAHPFQLTTTVQLNSGPVLPGAGLRQQSRTDDLFAEQPALPRNFTFPLPAGLVGNAAAMPQCEMTAFFTHRPASFMDMCPAETAIGVTSVALDVPGSLQYIRETVPVFNLVPAHGQPARFGFFPAGNPVVLDAAVDPDDENRIIVSVRNTTQLAQFFSATTTLWGTPGDPRHDGTRGWDCLARPIVVHGPCVRPGSIGEEPFLRQPVSCKDPLDFEVETEPWNVPMGSTVDSASFLGDPLLGCNQVPFDPKIAGSATSKLAENPSGFDFRLDMPNSGLHKPDAIAEGQAKKVVVTLPKGMTINPSQGEGLVGCSPADLARETASSESGAGCPNASKVGEVQISTPLLKEEAHGSLYVASPYDNPFDSLLALYMVARIPERGILLKQAGKVETDPATGQITTTFDDLPQLPFSSFNLHFREGGRAPLVTPPACGSYDVVAKFTPWSAADPDNPSAAEIVTRTSSFTVERGVDGGACPSGGTPPFHPGLLAGTTNNAAGLYSPFNVRLTRNDGEQEFTNFSIKLPPGVIGKLAGIPLCSDAGIAAAKSRTGSTGAQEELDAPSCPAGSQVGRTLVGAGVGSLLTYVPGKLYLAGPYHGSALSIVAITAAKVGPFDLGTVVVREALKINPDTAEVFVDATGSDPIPHIIQGIPVHAHDIRVYVDRPDFVLNPTSCERTSTASTVLGSGLDFGSAVDDQPVTVTSPFQAADCAALGFKPKLSLRLKGGTKRGATPALEAILKARPGDANISGAEVILPHSEFLEQSHIRTICTRVQFAAGEVPGEKCPAGSVYGHARAITPLLDEPIEGPVFLRSSPRPLPDLVAALHSGKIDVNVTGYIDSVKGGRLRTRFATVPDAPVTKFVLKMQGGQKSLLVNSTDICKGKHPAIADFTGHNGRSYLSHPLLKGASCNKGGKKGKHPRRHRG